jgi:hypothetical protein
MGVVNKKNHILENRAINGGSRDLHRGEFIRPFAFSFRPGFLS